jgi:hypothetical protein
MPPSLGSNHLESLVGRTSLVMTRDAGASKT